MEAEHSTSVRQSALSRCGRQCEEAVIHRDTAGRVLEREWGSTVMRTVPTGITCYDTDQPLIPPSGI